MTEDQTEFMNQEPWLEDGTSQVLPAKPEAAVTLAPSSRRKMLLVAGIGGVILIFLAVIMLLLPKPPAEVAQSPTPLASALPAAADAFTQRFKQVQADLKAADPAKRELPLPPVDTKIQLKYGETIRK